MPILPWKNVSKSDQDKFIAMLTYLPLKNYRSSFRFMYYVGVITNQLNQTPGLIGYTLKASPTSKKYWTLSVWKDNDSLNKYVQTMPHSLVMKKLHGSIGSTDFKSWEIKKNELPLDIRSALKKFKV